jgi:hypothetical protein
MAPKPVPRISRKETSIQHKSGFSVFLERQIGRTDGRVARFASFNFWGLREASLWSTRADQQP